MKNENTKKKMVIIMTGDEGSGKRTLIKAMKIALLKNKDKKIIKFSSDPIEFETNSRLYAMLVPEKTLTSKLMHGFIDEGDTGIVVVSSTDLVTDNTKEEISILKKVLKISNVVVFVNKVDLIYKQSPTLEDAQLTLAKLEQDIFKSFEKANYKPEEIQIIYGSAITALEIGKKKDVGIDHPGLKSISDLFIAIDSFKDPIPVAEKAFLMPIQNVFDVPGVGIYLMGQIERGSIGVGDTLDFVGFESTKPIKIIGIEAFEKRLEKALPNMNVGLIIQNGDIEKTDVIKGMVVAATGSIVTHRNFLAEIFTEKRDGGKKDKPLQLDSSFEFYFRETFVDGDIKFLEVSENASENEIKKSRNRKNLGIPPLERESVEVNLINFRPIERGLRFGLMEKNRLVGVGVVTGLWQELGNKVVS